MKRQLPGHHFLLTFTVPENLRRFIRKNQRMAYSALFRASSEAIKKLTVDQKYIGGDLPGFLGVLHILRLRSGQALGTNPRVSPPISITSPPEAPSPPPMASGNPSRTDFYLPVRALSIIFKAKFRDEMKEAGLFDQIPSEVWQIDWNVNSQAVGSSEASLKYLAPYVFRVAISNSRIVNVENRTVFIRYRKPHSHRLRTLALEVMEFIRRFLQHVLPNGFMKVRYYGFMNPNCGVPLDRISTLIEMSYGFNVVLPNTDLEPWQPIRCPTCGGTLRLCSLLLPCKILLWSG